MLAQKYTCHLLSYMQVLLGVALFMCSIVCTLTNQLFINPQLHHYAGQTFEEVDCCPHKLFETASPTFAMVKSALKVCQTLWVNMMQFDTQPACFAPTGPHQFLERRNMVFGVSALPSLQRILMPSQPLQPFPCSTTWGAMLCARDRARLHCWLC